MMPKEALAWANMLEKNIHDLNRQIYGVDCWPVVRNVLLSLLVTDITRHKRIYKKKNIFRSFYSIISVFFIRKSDTLFLTDLKYLDTIKGKKYIKDSFALSVDLKSKSKTLLIGLMNKEIDSSIEGSNNCFSLYGVIVTASLISRFSLVRFLFPLLINYVEKIHSHLLETNFYNSELIVKDIRPRLIKNLFFCILSRHLFLVLLSRVRPEKCYIHCYYSILGMAFCSACSKKGIPVADVQHGVSGRNMRAYAEWRYCPVGGYNTLPSEFFTWTSFDAQAISAWSDVIGNIHGVKNTGNIWRNYLHSSGLLESSLSEWSDFIDSISLYKRKIAITLQSEIIDTKIIDIISLEDKNLCFLIRCHPDFKFEELKLKNNLSKFKNVYIEEPTAMPICTLMKISDLNITEWSASVYDAYFENLKTIVIKKYGQDYFRDFIDSRIVLTAENYNELFIHIYNDDSYHKIVEDF